MKKILTLFLTLLLIMTMIGCTDKNVKTEDVKAHHKQIIQNVVNRYGVMNQRETIMEGKNQKGLMAAEAIDITKDGKDELLLIFGTADSIQMQVYEGKEMVWSDSADYTGVFDFVVRTADDNTVYWHYGQMRSVVTDIVAYIDKEYKKSNDMGEITKEQWDYINTGTDGLAGEGQRLFNVMLENLGLTQEKGFAEGVLYSYSGLDTQKLTSYWDVIIPEPKYTPMELLDKLAYYGDKEKCKMTKEMALAYKGAIESEEIAVKNANKPFIVKAVLMDIANDGMPLLITAMLDESVAYDEVAYIDENTEPIGIWTWDGEKAEKYNFKSDTESKMIFGYQFVKDADEEMIYVGDDVAMDVGNYSGHISYKVSNAMISKVNHVLTYSVYQKEIGSGVMFGGKIPGVNAKKLSEWEYSATVEELLSAGWVGDNTNVYESKDYTSLSLRTVNGKIIKYSNIEEYQNDYEAYGYYGRDSYEIILTTTGNECIDGEWTASDDAEKILELYSKVAGKPVYSYDDVTLVLSSESLEAVKGLLKDKYKGEIGEIYKIGDDLYYVLFYVGDEFEGGALVKNGAEWRIVTSGAEPMTEEAISTELNKDQSVSNIDIDLSNDKGADYLEKVLQNIDGTVPNRTAKEYISVYVENYISNNSKNTIKAKNNIICLEGEDVQKGTEKAVKAENALTDVLNKYNAMPNKEIEKCIKFMCKKADLSEGVHIAIDKNTADLLDNADAICFIIGEEAYSVTVSCDNLKALTNEYGIITIIIKSNGKNNYEIQFKDENGSVIDKIICPISITVPAKNELCTIEAQYTGGTDNWGGQFDSVNSSIKFDTVYSGTYAVLETNIDITDISGLTEEQQKAIRFMVSKEYLSVTDGKFNPEGELTRYDFSEALVRMFFSLDRTLTTSFTDVPVDIKYYPFVASGEHKNIIEGYEDKTFRGNNAVLREEAIALCSRALRERKGYTEPSYPYNYLHYSDNEDMSDWALTLLALASREGLIDDGGMLYPQEAISRGDSALLLYRLFMLLYQVEPVGTTSGSGIPVIPIVAVSVTVLVLAAATILIIFKKKNKKI